MLIGVYVAAVFLTNLSNICRAAEVTASFKQETDLIRNLLNTTIYDKEITPQKNASEPVMVNIGFNIVSILDLNEKEGSLATTFFPRLTWTDPRLSWTKNDSYPFEKVTISSSRVWKPDLLVYNSLISTSDASLMDVRVVVNNDGQVIYYPYMVIKTPCQFNLEYFPFDLHTCHITFGPWTASSKEVDITVDSSASLHSYMEHQDWNLKDYKVESGPVHFHAPNDSHSQVRITITVARRSSSFYYRLFIAPAAVCLFAIPIIHFIPPSSNEKLTLAGLVLVAGTIMFEMAEEFFPPFSANNIPLLLHYYTALLVLLFLSMLLSCLSIMTGTGDTKSKRVPVILRKFCLSSLGRVCCLGAGTQGHDYELLTLERNLINAANGAGPVHEVHEDDDDEPQLANNATSSVDDTRTPQLDTGLQEVLKSLVGEMQYVRYKKQVMVEWAQLAVVLDRLGGLVLLLLAIIMTAVVAAGQVYLDRGL